MKCLRALRCVHEVVVLPPVMKVRQLPASPDVLRLSGWSSVRTQFFRNAVFYDPEVTFLTDLQSTSVIRQATSNHAKSRFTWTIVEFCVSGIRCVIFEYKNHTAAFSM